MSLASVGSGGDVHGSKSIKEGEVVDLTKDSDAEEGSMSPNLSALLADLRGMVIDEVGRFLTAAHAATDAGVDAGEEEDREVLHRTVQEAGVKDFPFLANVCLGDWEGKGPESNEENE